MRSVSGSLKLRITHLDISHLLRSVRTTLWVIGPENTRFDGLQRPNAPQARGFVSLNDKPGHDAPSSMRDKSHG